MVRPRLVDTMTGWPAHFVSQFACNARLIVDASSNPTVSCVKKPRVKSSSKQTEINIVSSITQIVIH